MIDWVVLCGLGIVTFNHLILASGAVFGIGLVLAGVWVIRSASRIARRFFGG